MILADARPPSLSRARDVKDVSARAVERVLVVFGNASERERIRRAKQLAKADGAVEARRKGGRRNHLDNVVANHTETRHRPKVNGHARARALGFIVGSGLSFCFRNENRDASSLLPKRDISFMCFLCTERK